MTIKSFMKLFIPETVLRYRRNYFIKRIQENNKSRSAKEVFSEIYRKNYWGGIPGEICSGAGSTGKVADFYCDMVNDFIKQYNIKSVVDIGCGDFRIGSRIAPKVDSYTGIDIVQDIISYNNTRYSSDKIRFLCIDATADDIPSSDLCLIRQVFQHLSNKQISLILKRLVVYDYVMVTEHSPSINTKFIANKDKLQGADTRVDYNSAVVLDMPPFNVSPVKIILSIPFSEDSLKRQGVLSTYLFNGNAVGNADV